MAFVIASCQWLSTNSRSQCDCRGFRLSDPLKPYWREILVPGAILLCASMPFRSARFFGNSGSSNFGHIFNSSIKHSVIFSSPVIWVFYFSWVLSLPYSTQVCRPLSIRHLFYFLSTTFLSFHHHTYAAMVIPLLFYSVLSLFQTGSFPSKLFNSSTVQNCIISSTHLSIQIPPFYRFSYSTPPCWEPNKFISHFSKGIYLHYATSIFYVTVFKWWVMVKCDSLFPVHYRILFSHSCISLV